MFGACSAEQKDIFQQKERGTALGTTYTIIYEVPQDTVSYRDAILKVFDTVNGSMSTYIPSSDISKVNRGDTVVVDGYFQEVFAKSVEVWEATGGVFDPTVGALVNAWGFGPDEGLSRLDDRQVDSILAFTGLDKVFIDSLGRVIKAHPSLYLDFNALAKGYCIDLVGRALEEKGVENYLIELGGEILCKGSNRVKGKEWMVAIDNPEQQEGDRVLISRITLRDRAMATSGNYRKFRIDEQTGERYVHTIDPRSGRPFRNSVLSTSVIATTCMEADAYATAFMVMSTDSIKAFLGRHKNLEAYIISDGENGALEEYFTPGFQDLLVQ